MEQMESPESASEDHGRVPRVEMSAEAALELLLAGKPLIHAKVRGLRLQKQVFEKPVQIRNSMLAKPEFVDCEFRGGLDITGSTLSKPYLLRCRSAAPIKMAGCEISTPHFRELAATRLNFGGSSFTGNAKLMGLKISDGLSVWDARFGGWLELHDSEIGGKADFRSFHADEGVNVRQCVFAGDVLFRGSHVQKKFDLTGSRFDGQLDLSKVKFQDYAYLEEITFGPNGTLSLRNALAERLQLKPEQLENRLASEKEGHHDVAANEYATLKASYQKLHRFDEEDWAFYRFKVATRKAKPFSWSRPLSALRIVGEWLLFDRACGYGTQPFRAIVAGLSIVLGFAVIYAAGFRLLDVEKPPFDQLPAHHWANVAVTSLTTSTSVFTSGLGADQLSKAHGWVLAPLAIEALLGTLLWGLFIVSFSRKVIR
jgi:hypothetical protein